MDYKQALHHHITFEKEVKPLLLDNLAFHKKNIKINKQKKIDHASEDSVWRHGDLHMLSDEEQEEHLKHCADEIKFSQTGAKCWAYLHNKDYENAVKYYEHFKPLCHERIEDTDIIIKQDGEIYTNDNAYLTLCNSIKNELDSIEMLITFISDAKDVSVILKAGKKMNKRKNGKKNRG